MGIRSLALRVGVAALAVVGSVSCSSAVSGQGSAGSGSGPSGSSSADFPSQSAAPATSPASQSTEARSPSSPEPSPSATYQVVTVHGTDSGRTVTARVYASDNITDCAAHAYGPIVEFLRKNPCYSAHRVLATSVVNGRTAVLSGIATGFRGTSSDPYGVATRFTKLEKQDGTGSINDLLREGHIIAGIANRIPQHEVFQVIGQDNGVTVFDAWYADGTTNDHDATLKKFELELFLTPLTSR